MHHYLCLVGGIVIEALDLDLALVDCLLYALDERTHCLAVWQVADGECLLVDFLDTGAHTDNASSRSIMIL